MVNQIEVTQQVLATIGTVGIKLADAVAKADVLKPMKNKNKIKNWENNFKTYGNVVEGVVTQKVVVVPTVVTTPEVVVPTVIKFE